jgi:hypothetical protein
MATRTLKGFTNALGRDEQLLVCGQRGYVDGRDVRCGDRHPVSGAPVQCSWCFHEKLMRAATR